MVVAGPANRPARPAVMLRRHHLPRRSLTHTSRFFTNHNHTAPRQVRVLGGAQTLLVVGGKRTPDNHCRAKDRVLVAASLAGFLNLFGLRTRSRVRMRRSGQPRRHRSRSQPGRWRQYVSARSSSAGYSRAIAATIAEVILIRSAGASSISNPRLPPETNTVSKSSTVSSRTVGSLVFCPIGEIPPTI
jgi:hypothetical protein